MKGNKIIFLIDDDVDDLHFMNDISISLGHTTQLFYNGPDMFSVLNSIEIKPNIIFLDINMPMLDGFEVLEKLRHTKEEFKDIPVIIHSSHRDEKSIKRCYELGANYFITKAFNYNDLKSSIEYAINKDWKTFKASLHDFKHEHTC
jgi:CheY-like chemotaxis protein